MQRANDVHSSPVPSRPSSLRTRAENLRAHGGRQQHTPTPVSTSPPARTHTQHSCRGRRQQEPRHRQRHLTPNMHPRVPPPTPNIGAVLAEQKLWDNVNCHFERTGSRQRQDRVARAPCWSQPPAAAFQKLVSPRAPQQCLAQARQHSVRSNAHACSRGPANPCWRLKWCHAKSRADTEAQRTVGNTHEHPRCHQRLPAPGAIGIHQPTMHTSKYSKRIQDWFQTAKRPEARNTSKPSALAAATGSATPAPVNRTWPCGLNLATHARAAQAPAPGTMRTHGRTRARLRWKARRARRFIT